jgi:hypothetical protein
MGFYCLCLMTTLKPGTSYLFGKYVFMAYIDPYFVKEKVGSLDINKVYRPSFSCEMFRYTRRYYPFLFSRTAVRIIESLSTFMNIN